MYPKNLNMSDLEQDLLDNSNASLEEEPEEEDKS
jgi:hypothetical protein